MSAAALGGASLGGSAVAPDLLVDAPAPTLAAAASPGGATGLEPPPAAAAPTSRSIGLGRRALGGFVWMVAQNVVARGAAFASQLALAALLVPGDFGLIGLAYGVTTVAQALTDVGVEDVLLQRRDRLALWSGPAFAITFTLFTLAGLAVAAVAPFVARAYGAPHLAGLLFCLGGAMPLAAFSTVPGAVLRARLRFRFLAGWGSFEAVGSAALTVAAAAAGLGAYSFVLPLPVLAVARALVWTPIARREMPIDFRPKPRRWRFLVGNSALTLGTRLCMAMSAQGSYAVLGMLATPTVVGRYYFGFRLAAQPLFMLAGNVAGVLMPALVQLRNEPARQGAAALLAARMVCACVMPLGAAQLIVAAPLIERFFPGRWAASIPVIEVLSVALAFDAVSWLAGALLNARGEFKAQLINQTAQLPVFLLLVAIGAHTGGALGTAIASAVYYLTTQPFYVWTVFRRIGLGVGDVASIYLRPALLAAVAAGAGRAVAAALVPPELTLAFVGTMLVVLAAVYAGLMRFLDPITFTELRARVGGFR